MLALFDLDDTLVGRWAAFQAWAVEFTREHGLDEQAHAYVETTGARHTGPMGSFFTTICGELDLATPPEQVWARYRRRMPELTRTMPGVPEALKALRHKGWRIGIVTNGMADNQLGKIQNTGLADLVDAWCISGEVGIRKPDPEIFRLAAERCGGRLEQGWMVGDSATLDVAGGHAAGLRTIWVRPGGGSITSPAPDAVVDDVPQAVAVLTGR